MVLCMRLNYLNDIIGIIGFILTFLTFIATLNVRSQIIHFNERRNFQANCNHIVGKLDGFTKSLLEDNLNNDRFYQQIDIYITDLTSKYTFLNLFIKIKCKYIGHILQYPQSNNNYQVRLAKNLTQLKNQISKEAEL